MFFQLHIDSHGGLAADGGSTKSPQNTDADFFKDHENETKTLPNSASNPMIVPVATNGSRLAKGLSRSTQHQYLQYNPVSELCFLS